MEKVLILKKNIGETPLACIERFKASHPEYKDIPMTYAGRLDPMADGLLLVLAGDECKKKEQYLKLTKEYELEILFGVATDTYDILGKVIYQHQGSSLVSRSPLDIERDEIMRAAKTYVGRFEQEYPPYSSKPVEGKPLFKWARQGIRKLLAHEVEIMEVGFLEERGIHGMDLLSFVEERVAMVRGDFRQDEILQSWREALRDARTDFKIMKMKVSCGSGVYMRVLAKDIGAKMGMPALALGIRRTKIGDFTTDSVSIY